MRQLEDSLAALQNLDFDAAELAAIEPLAVDGDVDLWKQPSSA